MPAAPTGQHRNTQPAQFLSEQPLQRRDINPGHIPHQHSAQPFELARQAQMRQQTVDPVQRFVDVFDKQDDVFAVQFKRRAHHRADHRQIATQQTATGAARGNGRQRPGRGMLQHRRLLPAEHTQQ